MDDVDETFAPPRWRTQWLQHTEEAVSLVYCMFWGTPRALEVEDEGLIRYGRKITYFGKLRLDYDLAVAIGK